MLLEHNKEVYEQLETTLQNNSNAIVIMGTGVGKTYVTKEYIENHCKNPLIISPRRSICDSWKRAVPNSVSVTYQKVSKNYKQIDFSKYDVIVWDEIHHVGAATYLKAFQYIKDNYAIKSIGLTADSVRYTDGCMDVGEKFFDGNFCYGESISSAIEKKILNPIKYIGAYYNTDGIKNAFGKKITNKLYAKLDLAINKTPTADRIIKDNISGMKVKGIIFAPSIDDMDDAISFVMESIPGIKAKKMSSKLPDSENQEALEWFNGADEGILCSVNMVSEGVHIQGVNTLIMLRRTSSPTLFIQQLGRCLSSSNKEQAVVFDFVNNKINLGTMARKRRNERSMIEETSKLLSKASKQIIVEDYTKEIVSVLDEINETLMQRNAWTEDELRILNENYRESGSRKTTSMLPNKTRSMVEYKAKLLGLTKDLSFWTEDEIKILMKNYEKLGPSCASMLPRHSKPSVQAKAGKLGLSYFNAWTDEECKLLADNYGKISKKEICEMLPNHTPDAIARKAGYLGASNPERAESKWTDEEIAELKKRYPTEKTSSIAKSLGKRTEEVRSKASHMNLRKEAKYGKWSEEEKKFMTDNYNITMKRAEIAKRLGRTVYSVMVMANEMGLTKRRAK